MISPLKFLLIHEGLKPLHTIFDAGVVSLYTTDHFTPRCACARGVIISGVTLPQTLHTNASPQLTFLSICSCQNNCQLKFEPPPPPPPPPPLNRAWINSAPCSLRNPRPTLRNETRPRVSIFCTQDVVNRYLRWWWDVDLTAVGKHVLMQLLKFHYLPTAPVGC